MATYIEELAQKKYIPNIIIKMKGKYFSLRKPDSGLGIDSENARIISGLTVNPTAIDPFRPTTTIASSTFRMLDKDQVITKLFNGNVTLFQKELVEIWLGRCGVGMDFSDYFKLPNTYINKVSKIENGYQFQAVAAQDRLATGAFQTKTKLAVDIVSITTIITVQSVVGLPTAGYVKIEDEFISYTGITDNNLTGCIRGELSSTPVAHQLGSDVSLISVIQDNPINILLQLLISSGGGGVYDVLPDGAGIDQSLVDIAQFESVRDEFFAGKIFRFPEMGNIANLRDFIDNELCYPLGVRLRSNNNSKIGLAVLNRAIFEIDVPIIDHDEMTKNPTWDVEDSKIVNQVRINWDYQEATGIFLQQTDYTDADSITTYGKSNIQQFNFKGIKAALGGQAISDDIALLFLNRFSVPRPSIIVNTHASSSYLNIGDKTDLFTTTLPNEFGELNLSVNLEVINKAFNVQSGDVKFQLSYTSFSGIRQCFIAPSDTFLTFADQKTVDIAAGRGDQYRVGWVMKLYSNVSRDYASTQKNRIVEIVGDTIIFEDDWSTALVDGEFRMMFADYDDVTEQQKKFCFISAGTDPFIDGREYYQITFG